MARFRRKAFEVTAERITEEGGRDVDTFGRLVRAKRGDWVLVRSLGDFVDAVVVSDLIFRELFEPIDMEAETLLKEDLS